MLREYVEHYYLPLADSYRKRNVEAASAIQDWYQQLELHWPRIHFGNITSSETNEGYQFEVQVYLDDLSVDYVNVELYADALESGEPFCYQLERGAQLAGTANAYVYHGKVPTGRPASDYTPRIVPAHQHAHVPLEANFILWYR
jgi:starch phosphorylase